MTRTVVAAPFHALHCIAAAKDGKRFFVSPELARLKAGR